MALYLEEASEFTEDLVQYHFYLADTNKDDFLDF